MATICAVGVAVSMLRNRPAVKSNEHMVLQNMSHGLRHSDVNLSGSFQSDKMES